MLFYLILSAISNEGRHALEDKLRIRAIGEHRQTNPGFQAAICLFPVMFHATLSELD